MKVSEKTIEKMSSIIYETMRWGREEHTPRWLGGNSHAENRAREAARDLLAIEIE